MHQKVGEQQRSFYRRRSGVKFYATRSSQRFGAVPAVFLASAAPAETD